MKRPVLCRWAQPFANRMLRISGAACMALCRSASGSRLPRGCGRTTNGYPGMPRMLDIALPLEINGSVHITAVGIPRFSRVIPSCTLHDEQEPQSPDEVITTSHCSTS